MTPRFGEQEMRMQPTIAVMLGDRNGIGPELVAKFLADREAWRDADVRVVGDPEVAEHGCRIAGSGALPAGVTFVERSTCPGEPIGTGTVSAVAGAEVLDHFAFLLDLFNKGEIHGIVFGPLNKQ